ncbi:hypothetical protein TVAG_117540 [Trichomonas vaginalis G3]|uniref:Leucine Rich Repeat family protein n=1 Tax=Trichomonas vaginalis (strain ATCC PRA-98 / G3) TaxID=412133 RepID=A2E3U4_TRIV3|nr:leucine-rich repeat, isoform f-related family [Trichomonas vaginalis G3]EAY12732.1 hypothetical protein TVAG_117540 [Trichomonas vaginalis G3]KAI5517506.1 leucine-rich repeat, isoform f-related family [Trichomonas vaginalis G3]|eukprot:XP_001324955.1 hypothetical protein [Trichomonas vaginalis G3]
MNDALLNSIRAKLQFEHKAVFSLGPVKDNSLSVFKKLRVVAITEYGYEVYSKTNGELKKIFTWSSLNSIAFQGNIARFVFDKKKITSELPDGRLINGIIGHIFRQTIPSIRYKQFGLDTYGFHKIKGSNYGAFVRMKQLLIDKSITVTPHVTKAFEFFLRFSPLKFNYSELPEYRRLSEVFFGILPLIQSLQHLTIPVLETCEELANNPSSISKLRSLEFFGRKEPRLMEFLQNYKPPEKSNLCAIIFSHSEFDPEDIDKIQKFIDVNEVISLNIHNALDYSAEQMLYSHILTPKICNRLEILNLDKTRNVDLQKVIDLASNVTLLSLAGCNLQIADALARISKSRFPKLRFLNLSENSASFSPDPNTIIIPQLYSLMLNDIEWMGTSLPDTLNVIFKRGLEPFKLSIARAKASGESWQTVFRIFATTNYRSLTAFTWDGNPIHKAIFSFLHGNSFLDYLSLSDCFHHEIKDSVNDLCNFIDSTISLKFLTIRGTDRHHLGALAGHLLRCISRSPSILHLDISNNQIGDTGISALRTLLNTNRTIKVLVIDGSNPDNGQQFIETLNFASLQFPRLSLSYPINDVNYLLENSRISEEQYNNLLNNFKRKPTLKQSKRGCLFETPEKSPFMEPFYVFRHVPQDPFPIVLSEEQLKAVQNPPELPPLPPRPQMQRRAESVKRMPLNRPSQINTSHRPPISPKFQRMGSSQSFQPPQRQPASPVASPTSSPKQKIEVPFFLKDLENQIGGLGAFDSESTVSETIIDDYTNKITVSFGKPTKSQPQKRQKQPQIDEYSDEDETKTLEEQQVEITFNKPQKKSPVKQIDEYSDEDETKTLEEQQVELVFNKPQRKSPPKAEDYSPDEDLPPSPQSVRKRLQRNPITDAKQKVFDDYSEEKEEQPKVQIPQRKQPQLDQYSDEEPVQQVPQRRQQIDEYSDEEQVQQRRQQTSQRRSPVEQQRQRKQQPVDDDYDDVIPKAKIIPQRQPNSARGPQSQRIQIKPQLDEYSDEDIEQPKPQIQPKPQSTRPSWLDLEASQQNSPPKARIGSRLNQQRPQQPPQTARPRPVQRKQMNLDEYSDEEEPPKPQPQPIMKRRRRNPSNVDNSNIPVVHIAQQSTKLPEEKDNFPPSPVKRRRVSSVQKAQSAVGNKAEIMQRNQQIGVPQEQPQQQQHRHRVHRNTAQSAVGNKNELLQRNQQVGVPPEEQVPRRRKHKSTVGDPNEILQRNQQVIQVEPEQVPRRRKHKSTVGDPNEILQRNQQVIQVEPEQVPRRRKHKSTVGDANEILQRNQQVIRVEPEQQVLRKRKRKSVVGDEKEIIKRNDEIMKESVQPFRRRRKSSVANQNDIAQRNQEMNIQPEIKQHRRKVMAQSAVGDRNEIAKRNDQILNQEVPQAEPLRKRKRVKSAVGDKAEIQQRNKNAEILPENPPKRQETPRRRRVVNQIAPVEQPAAHRRPKVVKASAFMEGSDSYD